MLTALLAVLIFFVVAALISVGVILGKRTPLKGSCAAAGREPHAPGQTCDACTCGAAPLTGTAGEGGVGCGPVDQAPPAQTTKEYEMTEQKATNITWHEQHVTPADLEKLHGHKGCTVWFTGLSGSGKSTLANAVAATLHARGVSTFVLDGDNIRHGLNKNLGFSAADREENIRRVGEVARLFTAAAVVNMTAFISPYAADRDKARALQPETFIEVFCGASLEVCEERDTKGLYKKARAGEIKGFTGIDDPYESPERPELALDTGALSVEECVVRVLDHLSGRGLVSR